VRQHGKKQQKSEKEIILAYLQHKADAEISTMSKKILSTFFGDTRVSFTMFCPSIMTSHWFHSHSLLLNKSWTWCVLNRRRDDQYYGYLIRSVSLMLCQL